MSVDSALKTPLYDWHRSHGGRLVEFGGWLMPVQYTTIIEEHQAVRQRVGLFDISHMGRLTFDGPDALGWIDHVTTNHAATLGDGQIQYSLMANGGGGLIDDVLVYRSQYSFLIVCNASNRAEVLHQFEHHKGEVVARLSDQTPLTAMIALQGPLARETLAGAFQGPMDSLKYYHHIHGQLLGSVEAMVSRTGYTGEVGYEIIVPAADAVRVWEGLLEAGKAHGILPCGLGARDTLRFEAAMPLYGHEMNEAVNPYAAGLGWAVKLDKGDFVGRDALTAFKANPGQTRVGLRLHGKRIARQGSEVFHDGKPAGLVTSGTFAPTLGESLAMALVDPASSTPGLALTVDVRGKPEAATVVPLPFYQRPGTERPAAPTEPS